LAVWTASKAAIDPARIRAEVRVGFEAREFERVDFIVVFENVDGWMSSLRRMLRIRLDGWRMVATNWRMVATNWRMVATNWRMSRRIVKLTTN